MSVKAALKAVSTAFQASAKCEAALKTLGAKVSHSKTFRMQAAKIVCADANTFYHLTGTKSITVYEGQRDIAFGVVVSTDEDGKVKYERTKQADATRKWFQRNVQGKKASARPQPKGVWAKIAADISMAAKIRGKLTKSGDKATATSFHNEFERLVEKYFTRASA